MINSDSADKLDSEHAEEYDDREHAIVYGVSHASGCTVPQTSPKSLSTLDGTLGKAGQIMSGLDQNLESEIGPEFMELDVIEPQMYNSMAGEDSISLSEVSMGLETNTGLGLGLDASSGSQPEFQLDIAGGGLTTTSVWCGIEFFHEVADRTTARFCWFHVSNLQGKDPQAIQ